MQSISIILVLLPLIGLSSCANTQCGLWGKGAWRCAKDNAPADRINIKSSCNRCIVEFKIGKWHSQCHKKGKNDSTDTYAVDAVGKYYDFPAAADGKLHDSKNFSL